VIAKRRFGFLVATVFVASASRKPAETIRSAFLRTADVRLGI